MRTCPNCGATGVKASRHVSKIHVPFRRDGRDVKVEFQAQMQGFECPACRMAFEVGSTSERFELAVAREIIGMGISAGGLLKFVRKALGFRATELAELLDKTPETVSHWENDRSQPERSVWVALADMVDDRLEGKSTTRKRLEVFARPNQIPRGPVTVELTA
jgi:DNA-binding XRE family transcriptional regulator